MAEAIGIAHIGWRGTVCGITVATIAAMREQFGCGPAHIGAGVEGMFSIEKAGSGLAV